MLENARRQLMLVILVTAAAIVALATLPIKQGLDLKGGVQLIYEIDIEKSKAEGLIPKGATESDIQQIVDETVSTVAQRVDPTGTLDALVTRRGVNGILIELPDMTAEESRAVESRIESLGQLEFRLVATDDLVIEPDGPEGETITFDLKEERRRLDAWLAAEANKQAVQEDPLAIRVFNSGTGENGPQSRYLRWMPHAIEPSVTNRETWSSPMRFVDPQSGVQRSEVVPLYEPEALSTPPQDLPEGERRFIEYVPICWAEPHFEGENLDASQVRPTQDQMGLPAIGYQFLPEFEGAYADWSDTYTGQYSAIMLNGFVRSAPVFQQRISGPGIIRGGFSNAEAAELVKTLRSGALRVRPVQQSRNVIGATLGQRSIDLAFESIMIGAVLVLGFILVYYRLAGLVAFSALALNVLMLLGVVAFLRSTLTLPGLAGLVLTMGMAIDANILIYERIREELARGKELLQACRTGFDRAIVTILDANITTFIAGIVLFSFGVGPIRGFAVTLMIGIVTTLFTAFFVSRVAFHYLLESGRLKDFKVAHLLDNVHIPFLSKARLAIGLSVIVIFAGLTAFLSVPPGTKYAIDFTGGANLTVTLAEPASAQEIRDILHKDFAPRFDDQEPIVNTIGELDDGKSTQFAVRIKLTDERRAQIDELRAESDQATFEAPYVTALREVLGARLVEAPYSNETVDEPIDPNVPTNFASLELHFVRPVAPETLRDELKLGGLAVTPKTDDGEIVASPQAGAGYRNFVVEWDVPKDVTPEGLFGMVQGQLDGVTDMSGNPVSLSDPIPESSEIGGRMVGELRNSAISALVISLGVIVLFIRVRFHEYKYGIAAVLALVHDVLVTLGVVVAANAAGLVDAELDLAMVAAFLTIIGYSINDTIVIFDRVRENLSEQQRLGERIDHDAIVNLSINQTLSRTVLTTATTMAVVVTQFIVNAGAGTALEGFSFALLIGLLSGTYSTIFIASPVVAWLWKRERNDPTPATAGETANAVAETGTAGSAT